MLSEALYRTVLVKFYLYIAYTVVLTLAGKHLRTLYAANNLYCEVTKDSQ